MPVTGLFVPADRLPVVRMETAMRLAERLEGGLLGLLIGDAVGVPYEFHPPTALPDLGEIDMVPPRGFHRAHSNVAPGVWSDDGAQALCLLASLLHCGRLDVQDFGNRLVNWLDRGYMAVDGIVFDVGMQTTKALHAIRSGVHAHAAGPATEWDNGNGSLMRVLPLALWHRGSDAELAADAEGQSGPTHGHLRAKVCCAVYALWARSELRGTRSTLETAIEVYSSLCRDDAARQAELAVLVRHEGAGGSGYVVDCLRSAAVALEESYYAAVVRAAIAIGNDTDTTACVAGGLAGVRSGASGIPKPWRDGLHGKELVSPLLADLLARRG